MIFCTATVAVAVAVAVAVMVEGYDIILRVSYYRIAVTKKGLLMVL